MAEDGLVRLRHMLDAAREVIAFASGESPASLARIVSWPWPSSKTLRPSARRHERYRKRRASGTRE